MKSTVIMVLLFLVCGAAAALYCSSDMEDLKGLIEQRTMLYLPVE